MVEERAPTSFIKYNATLSGGLVGACKVLQHPCQHFWAPQLLGVENFHVLYMYVTETCKIWALAAATEIGYIKT